MPLLDRPYRVLAACSHPVQYLAPLLLRLALHPQLDLSVAYCSLRGAQPAHDPDCNTTVQWDIPLLEGYSWQEVPNWGTGDDSPWALFNPGLWELIRKGKFDAVLCYLSYLCASSWVTSLACRGSHTALLFGTGASSMAPRSGEASELHINHRVLFLGFQNQSQLPAVYTASDLMVLPSEYEPFAVVVNEASCRGCAVAVSDHVGAARDLVAIELRC